MSLTFNINQRLVELRRPAVMAIVNVTDDSFYRNSRTLTREAVVSRVRQAIAEGADIIDIGGMSTRPGGEDVSPELEMERVALGIEATRSVDANIPVSVDTFRASVAREAVSSLRADIVNDISGGTLDPKMFYTVAEMHCPYVLTHMRGTPADMMTDAHTTYTDVVADVLSDLARKIGTLRQLGVCDIIVDPGLGFAKTLEQNYTLLRRLTDFKMLECPLLVGASRKSMITRLLDVSHDDALNGTTALHAFALDRGADIVRVHDVAAARQCIDIYLALTSNSSIRRV